MTISDDQLDRFIEIWKKELPNAEPMTREEMREQAEWLVRFIKLVYVDK